MKVSLYYSTLLSGISIGPYMKFVSSALIAKWLQQGRATSTTVTFPTANKHQTALVKRVAVSEEERGSAGA
jgi:hypothetical protein